MQSTYIKMVMTNVLLFVARVIKQKQQIVGSKASINPLYKII